MPLAGGPTAVSKGRTVFVVATDGAAAYGIGEALGTAPGVDVITAGDGTPEALAALAAAVPDAALVVIGNGPEPTASGYTWDQPRPAPITGDQDSPLDDVRHSRAGLVASIDPEGLSGERFDNPFRVPLRPRD